MSLFDEPVSAHIGEDAVLWVGVVESTERQSLGNGSGMTVTVSQAIVVNAAGRVGLAPIQELNADWRWVPERGPYRPGTDGPGWVDLEEFNKPAIPTDIKKTATEAIVAALTEEAAKPGDLVEGRDYILGADGTKYDPSTNLPLDE